MKKDSLFWLLSFWREQACPQTCGVYRRLLQRTVWVELFEIARSWYLQAEKNHMKTEYFIELFERSHQYIDCDCACCKNSRQMAIGIIGTLFRDSKCVSIIKKKEDFSKQELIELFLHHVGTGLPNLTHKKSSILTFGCQLSDRWICW